MRDYVRAVGAQFRLMVNRKEFHLAYAVNLGYVLLTYLYYVICYWGQDVSRIPSPSAVCALLTDSRFFGVYVSIVPFLAVFPFAMSFFDDRKNAVLPVLQVRSGVRVYYVSKAVTCFLGGFLAFFIPLMIGMFLNNMTFPESGITFLGDLFDMNYDARVTGANVVVATKWAGLWFPRLFLEAPELFNLLYCLLFSVTMGIFGMFLYVVSFWIKRQKLLLLLPLFLILSALNIMDGYTTDHPPYLCLKIMQYVTPNAMYGKNPLYLYVFLLVMVLFSLYGIRRQIQKDQLD